MEDTNKGEQQEVETPQQAPHHIQHERAFVVVLVCLLTIAFVVWYVTSK